MSKHVNSRVRATYANGTWAFVDPSNPSFRLPLEQALIDVTYVRHHLVEGYVKAVHGVDMEQVKYLDSHTRSVLGIAGNHRLGRVGTMKRVRLMSDGTVEDVT